MLKNALIFAGASLLLVFLAPSILPMMNVDTPPPPPIARPAASLTVAPAAANDASGYREWSLPSDGRGQYFVDGYVDGVSVRFLVDTGASFVSISSETASRLGLAENASSPQYMLDTANGRVKSYGVRLSHLDLGTIYVSDVDAVVNPNMSGVNLLGANFLQRLSSVEQRDGRLILRQ